MPGRCRAAQRVLNALDELQSNLLEVSTRQFVEIQNKLLSRGGCQTMRQQQRRKRCRHQASPSSA